MMTPFSMLPANELRTMAQRLIEMADTAEATGAVNQHCPNSPPEARAPGELPPERLLALARMIYKARRGRAEFFNADLFADPAWDILLELFIAELCGKQTSSTRLCMAAAVPPTTASRYVAHLETVGLVCRASCETDARIQLRAITPKGLQLMRDYFEKYWRELAPAAPELMLLDT
jgi:DNA-binding MarR family transcriptional regulator